MNHHRADGEAVVLERVGSILRVSLNRPERRNAVDRETADALYRAFREFDEDDALHVAVLDGRGGQFCAGADLKALAAGQGNRVEADGAGPMGPTRMRLRKPVIAAVEGHAVAGGLELALWCDLRVAAEDAVFGVYCRRFGVPLIDGGTVRLARLIGQSRAMDMILTGRAVAAPEALSFGLVNRMVAPGEARAAATALAREIAELPQTCLRNDRASLLSQWGLDEGAALHEEFRQGMQTLRSGESEAGARQFSEGAGRHGRELKPKKKID